MEPVVDDPAHINRPKGIPPLSSPLSSVFHTLTLLHTRVDTPFRQQRLRACQPILTPFVVITVFVVLGVIMVSTSPSTLSHSSILFWNPPPERGERGREGGREGGRGVLKKNASHFFFRVV